VAYYQGWRFALRRMPNWSPVSVRVAVIRADRLRPRQSDDGMATVWAACGIAALIVVAAVVWTLGAAVVARHQAGNAADLAALAAAGHADGGRDVACRHAGDIAERMGVQVRECRLAGWDALVTVEAGGPGLLARFGRVTARARAGPVRPSGAVTR
jgi:secretion/DNA translocation related TadE-like protein